MISRKHELRKKEREMEKIQKKLQVSYCAAKSNDMTTSYFNHQISLGDRTRETKGMEMFNALHPKAQKTHSNVNTVCSSNPVIQSI